MCERCDGGQKRKHISLMALSFNCSSFNCHGNIILSRGWVLIEIGDN